MPAHRANSAGKSKKSSKAGHLKSRTHGTSLQALAERNARPPEPDLPDPRPAPLSFVDILGLAPELPLEPSRRPPSPSQNPFFEGFQYDNNFFDSTGDKIMFSAGNLPDHSIEERVEIQQQINRLALLQNHSRFGQFSDELETDTNNTESTVDGAFAAALRRMGERQPYSSKTSPVLTLHTGIEDESDEEGEEDFAFGTADREEAWFPHGSRTMFMLDLLDNLPRLRLSDDHLKAIIWVMRECKTPNVPSFSALRKKQALLTREVGIESEHHTSSLGNHFYMNHPAKLLALDWANPLVRPFIHVYPEVSGPISEFWKAGKWVSEIDFDDLSPMWADWKNKPNSHRHFYIKELAQLHDGTYVIPLRWVTVENVVHADGRLFDIKAASFRRIPASTLKSNYPDLSASAGTFKFTEYSPRYSMPHPLREKARGRPVFRLRIMPWSDDVSGNVSKQYNAHTNMYITNLNLPHQQLQQEYFIRFSSTSQHASSSEQFVALNEDCVPGVWHEAYDCELEEEIIFEIIPHVLPADNPQQSETCSHIGMAGSLGCRRDLTGGTKEYQETDEGYHAFYKPGVPRETDGTIQAIRWQFWLACIGNKSALDDFYTTTGVKDKISQYWISELLTKAKVEHHKHLSDRSTRDAELNNSGCKGAERAELKARIKRRIQQELWDWVVQQPNEFIPLTENDRVNPHADTPGEILHTYLLGNDKYVWHDTNKGWDDKKADIFASRLQASCINGLSIPPPRPGYVVQYKNSLIGKHFKMLQQLGVFSVHELCTPLLFDLWKATGELGALLWFPEIKDMDSYVADLEVLVDNLLDIWGLIDPNRILVKGKLHTISHLPDDARRFGPSIIYATEMFECWNTVFRLCSIFSNHLSPSHDIAVTLADMERFKHMVSGGWWRNSDGKYIRAGSGVRSFLTANRELQRRLGWSEKSRLESANRLLSPGTVKLNSAVKRHPTVWNLTLPEPHPIGSTWVQCKYVVAQSGDSCKPGFWVFVRREEDSGPFAARIAKILARDGSAVTQHNTIVIVEPFDVLDAKDIRLNMPVLVPSTGLASTTEIMFAFNAQHDCIPCKCRTNTVPVRQERIITDRTELQINHTTEERFILNMHGLHNAHLIREVLPRTLTAPVPYLPDRVSSHRRFAAQLRETGPAKRAEIRAKTQATRAKNKQVFWRLIPVSREK
ncbi:hypothetical protein DFH07DRAFT_865489 [Mycena maculata]|uniref:Uncharacterized protein n=1 Tax=Mycena maculata TaxID=230809 RepID=A0AAD7K5V9_9AGAR|nr:hypothetical protein DFH07DRAFT_865489 [Mycena maculata]